MLEAARKFYDQLASRPAGPEHSAVTRSLWILATWDESTAPRGLRTRPLAMLDKLWAERARPLAVTVKVQGCGPHSWTAGRNILTNAGMVEMARRSTGQTATTNTHHAIGVGAVAETVGDVALGNEAGRKAIGERTNLGRTERYATAFAAADVAGLPRQITEAGLFTAAAGGVMVARVTGAAQTLEAGNIITVQTNISHENGAAI